MAGGAGEECGCAGDGAVRDLAVWVLSGDRGCGRWCGIEGAGGAAAGDDVEDARVGCARGGGGRDGRVQRDVHGSGAGAGAGGGARRRAALRPVMAWKTRVLDVREVAAGETVGYNATFTAPGPMRL